MEEQPDHLEILTIEELNEMYKQMVGINPVFRGFSRERIAEGIKNPDTERARLREEDAEEDKEDLRTTYRR